jgi:hypothetical protein
MSWWIEAGANEIAPYTVQTVTNSARSDSDRNRLVGLRRR